MITALDHLVLTVASPERTVEFYRRLGMEHVRFGPNRHALTFGRQKINLHVKGSEFQPAAAQPTPGSADLCFLVDRSPKDVLTYIHGQGLDVVEGPVLRTGAQGPLVSVYIRDPDGNLIELAAPGNSPGTPLFI